MAGVQLDIGITDWQGVQKQLVKHWQCQGFPNTASMHRTHPCHFPSPGAGDKRVLHVPKLLSSIGGASSDMDQPAWLSSELS